MHTLIDIFAGTLVILTRCSFVLFSAIATLIKQIDQIVTCFVSHWSNSEQNTSSEQTKLHNCSNILWSGGGARLSKAFETQIFKHNLLSSLHFDWKVGEMPLSSLWVPRNWIVFSWRHWNVSLSCVLSNPSTRR